MHSNKWPTKLEKVRGCPYNGLYRFTVIKSNVAQWFGIKQRWELWIPLDLPRWIYVYRFLIIISLFNLITFFWWVHCKTRNQLFRHIVHHNTMFTHSFIRRLTFKICSYKIQFCDRIPNEDLQFYFILIFGCHLTTTNGQLVMKMMKIGIPPRRQ